MTLSKFPALVIGMVLAAVSTGAYAAGGPPVIHYFNASLSDKNKVTLEWKVTGSDLPSHLYIYKRGSEEDVGFEPVHCSGECSTSFRVKKSGHVYRYTLKVRSPGGTSLATAQVQVPPLTPPKVSQNRIFIGMFGQRTQTLSWTHQGPGYVLIIPPGNFFAPKQHYPATGDIIVDDLEMGTTQYRLVYCEEPAPQGPLCSSRTSVTFHVGPAQFDGEYRKFVNIGKSLTVTWSDVGSYWHITAPSLDIDKWVHEPQYTFDSGQLTEGVHDIYLVSCHRNEGCKNSTSLSSGVAGTVSFLVENWSVVQKGQTVAKLATDTDGPTREVIAPQSGSLHYSVPDKTHVQADQKIAYIETNDALHRDHHQIIVGLSQTVPTWDVRSWKQDFTATTYEVDSRPALGEPLDVTFDGKGHIWVLGEFSGAVGEAYDSTLTVHQVPLRHYWDGGLAQRVEPFTLSFAGKAIRSSKTALAENIIWNGERIWFTQGGTLGEYDANHSRVISFDPSSTNDPTTLPDERFCAIHVPGNNNAVIGVAWDSQRQRIWITLVNGPDGNPAIAWFKPAEFTGSCNNLLNYRSSAAVQAVSDANRCSTREQDGCIHFQSLPKTSHGKKPLPAHLEVGPHGYVWFTDFTGHVLGRYSVDAVDFDYFPMPNHAAINSLFLGFPWQLRVGADAVYIGEFGDVDLVRFDKNHPAPEDCMAPLEGENPCMSQLHLPMSWQGMRLHSIALHGDRLWFTLSNAARDPKRPMASTFGYIDVDSWASGAPHGVLYTGLSSLVSLPAGAHHSFRGIAVSSQGDIALANMYGGVIHLEPKP